MMTERLLLWRASDGVVLCCGVVLFLFLDIFLQGRLAFEMGWSCAGPRARLCLDAHL